jgi:hypothetical protein
MTSTKHCPQCGAQRIHRAHRRTRLEKFISLVGGSMRRCHACNLRVLQLAGCLIPVNTLQRLSDRAFFTALLALATLLVLAAIMWFGRIHSAPPEAFLLLSLQQ